MLRRTVAILATVSALLGATAAQAGTSWSIGINLPGAAVVVADGPRHYVREVTPVYYAAAPRYVEREVYYAPPPRVVYQPHYRHRHVHHHHSHRWDDRRHDRRDDRRDDRRNDRRDDHGPHRGR
ncbi:hypothetical protein [Roseateles sp. LYH14W]|uniref:DUF3300 domain-containing protein n=1 Tax=Pelomonas parva TaxID=3299032 RepID=A0ABW7EVR9_9BURK